MRLRWWTRISIILGGILIIAWSFLPVYWGIIVSVSTPARIQLSPPPIIPYPGTLSNYMQLLNFHSSVSGPFLRALLNSSLESVLTTVLGVACATAAAYAFVRYKFFGGTILFLIMVGTLSLPIYAIVIPLYQLIAHFKLIDTYIAVIIVNAVFVLPLAMWLIRSHIASLPTDIEEAAIIDGANLPTLVMRIVLPLVSPGIASASIIVFIISWGSFFIPLIFAPTIGTTPLSVIVTQYVTKYSQNYGLQAAAGILALIVPAIVVLVLSKRIIGGLTKGALNA